MKKIAVSLATASRRDCLICIGDGVITRLGSLYDLDRYSKVVVVTDEVGEKLWLQELQASLGVESAAIVLPSGEQAKSIDSIELVWKGLHDAGCDRQSLVINLGGGVICDLGGFAASTYMRGLDFLHVPTTLLAQVDASVGGKTGFNFAGIKNLIGTFSQPIGIVIDPQVLASLPKREFTSGFGEIIKQALIWDKDYFRQVTAKRPADFSNAELETIMERSCRIKLEVVSADEKEAGSRKLLNYGHTIGHAFEALSLEGPRPLLHGEAVSLGMVAENHIATHLGLLTEADAELVKKALLRAGLPIRVSDVDQAAVIGKMRSDKKNKANKFNFVLINSIGHALYDQAAPDELVAEAVGSVIHK